MESLKRAFSYPIVSLTLVFIAVAFLIGTYLLYIRIYVSNKNLSQSKSISSNVKNQSKTAHATSYEDWTDFVNGDFQLRLQYPPQFKNYGWGTLSTSTGPSGDTGSEICINLDGCLRDKTSDFEIRSTSEGWSSSKPSRFTDLQGYRKANGVYFARLPSGGEVEIPQGLAEEIKSGSGVEILLIKGGGNQANKGYPDAGWIGALINKDLPVFKGIAVQMKITQDLDEDIFRKILSTIEFPYENDFPDDNEIQKELAPAKYLDGLIKNDMKLIAKAINCRFLIDKQYPKYYYPDSKCGTSGRVKNPATQKPYYYTSTDNGQGFILKAKLSTGEIYTISEKTLPPR